MVKSKVDDYIVDNIYLLNIDELVDISYKLNYDPYYLIEKNNKLFSSGRLEKSNYYWQYFKYIKWT